MAATAYRYSGEEKFALLVAAKEKLASIDKDINSTDTMVAETAKRMAEGLKTAISKLDGTFFEKETA